MNDLLNLKGNFEQATNSSKPGSPNLPTGKSINVSKLLKLLDDLTELKSFWLREKLIPGALISVFYNKVAAKSNRIQGILAQGSSSPNSSIVGARFSTEASPKHIITHYVLMNIIDESINRLRICIEILNENFNGTIDNETIKKIIENDIRLPKSDLAKTNFVKVIVDSYYVEKFDVFVDDSKVSDESIITLYKTDVKTKKLLEKIGIDIIHTRVMDETTILLRPEELLLLRQKAPYLISMAVSDITQLTKDHFDNYVQTKISIPSPKNEPTIGVIDTMFDKSVYFSEWVNFVNMLPEDIPLSPSDYIHGTAVTSIIVDGPASNPKLDDGCGRFRVRHFGVAAGNKFSSFTILRNINEIITSNKDG